MEIKQDITKVKKGYIVQQCNCITLYPLGLARDLDKAFPGSCPYYERKSLTSNTAKEQDRDSPGTVQSVDFGDVVILNLFGQYAPGKPSRGVDSRENRLEYFKHGLEIIEDYLKDRKDDWDVYFPYKIGCGLAGGRWEEDYLPAILDFSKRVKNVKICVHE